MSDLGNQLWSSALLLETSLDVPENRELLEDVVTLEALPVSCCVAEETVRCSLFTGTNNKTFRGAA